MTKYFIVLFFIVLAAQTHAQQKLKIVCGPPVPLQQIGGPKVVLDPLLVYRVCIDTAASDNAAPQLARHLVGVIEVANNSKYLYQLRVYFFWKGNQVTAKLHRIKSKGTQLYRFNLRAKPGKENENSYVEVRSDQVKKSQKPFIAASN